MDYDQTKGLIYFGSAASIDEDLFIKIVHFNPKMRLLLLMNDLTTSTVKSTCLKAWLNHKILNIYMIDSIILIKAHAYNPFNGTIITFNMDNIKGGEIQSFEKDRIKNLHGHILKVTYFKFFMVADGKTDSKGKFDIKTLRFPDGEALRLLSKKANFTVEFLKTPDGVTYGWKTANGSYTGEKKSKIILTTI